MKSLQVEMESAQRTLTKKANVKDTCALVDVKANTKDVFKVFEEIKRSIEIVSSKQQNLEATKNFSDILNE